MTPQADRLFIHSNLISKNCCFCQNTAFINCSILQHFPQFCLQTIAIVNNGLTISLLNLSHKAQNCFSPASKIPVQCLPFCTTHGIVSTQCFVHNRHEISQELFLVRFGLLYQKNIRQPG